MQVNKFLSSNVEILPKVEVKLPEKKVECIVCLDECSAAAIKRFVDCCSTSCAKQFYN